MSFASALSRATRARRIGVAVFDVDGVMTDGRIYLGESGEETKAFNVADGFGLRMLLEADIEVAILSGRRARISGRLPSRTGDTRDQARADRVRRSGRD